MSERIFKQDGDANVRRRRTGKIVESTEQFVGEPQELDIVGELTRGVECAAVDVQYE